MIIGNSNESIKTRRMNEFISTVSSTHGQYIKSILFLYISNTQLKKENFYNSILASIKLLRNKFHERFARPIH